MKKYLKIELKRGFCNRMYVISLLIGCTIALLQIFLEVLPVSVYNYMETSMKNVRPHSVFQKWMGSSYLMLAFVFFTIFPLLAAIPFGGSLTSDRRTGYIKNIFTRINKKTYYTCKFITVFLTGATAAVLPLFLNLLLSMMILPSLLPDIASSTFPISATSAWAEIFYTHPFLYLFIYFCLIFIASGILTTLTCAFSFLVKYEYVVLLTPFLFYQGISFLSSFFVNESLDMQRWLVPWQPVKLDFAVIIIELSAIIIFTLSVYVLKSKRSEGY